MKASPSPNKRPISNFSGRQPDDYLTTADVARRTGFSVRALETLRHRKIGPPSIKIGRSVRYRWCDVCGWIEQSSANEDC